MAVIKVFDRGVAVGDILFLDQPHAEIERG